MASNAAFGGFSSTGDIVRPGMLEKYPVKCLVPHLDKKYSIAATLVHLPVLAVERYTRGEIVRSLPGGIPRNTYFS